MVSEQPATVLHLNTSSASQDWHFATAPRSLAAVTAFVGRAARGCKSFLLSPMFPSAVVWEANMLVRSLSSRESAEYKPDPFSTEPPFMSDALPRGK